MARRKSDAEVGIFGVWAYNTRDLLGLSPEQVTGDKGVPGLLPTTYHPATLRKIESGATKPPPARIWRELNALYSRIGAERGLDIEPQPRLAPEPVKATGTPDQLVAALTAQTAALTALAAEIRLSRAEEFVTREALMRTLGVALDPRGMLGADALGTPAGAQR